ncbi:class I SAM-dependent methyltransferase [Sphingomonas mesophila]|uniref:class I SAM-dependent methyltransferase n=1 Tax=Sphingomonas mesophila TaxID=2303576 RepID=UPI0013C35DD9|nr:class I SAM-dependent methyltransferase [Sphingomonas mesophila]
MAMPTADWAGDAGATWARWWQATDRALAPVGEALDAALLAVAPSGQFRALDIGCGPGTTTLALAARRPDSTIIGCDLSEPLIAIARERAAASRNVRFLVEDAEVAAAAEGPFDLIVSRHGVMFFDNPARAFAALRLATAAGGTLVFTCFQSWHRNPWAFETVAAVAGTRVPEPGREPGGFAFADPDHVRDLLDGAGWSPDPPRAIDFDYVAGEGAAAVDDATAFLTELGPAARALAVLPPEDRAGARASLTRVIAAREHGNRIVFPAAAWLWSARAA